MTAEPEPSGTSGFTTSRELITVQLTDLGDGRTEMHFEQRGHQRPDEYDRTQQGWGTFFDRIDERLAAAS